MAPPRSDVSDSSKRLARAAMLIDRYSLAITALVEDVVGVGSSGNHEVQVLTALVESPGRRPRDLMELTGLSRAGVAMLVSRLERIGLVERTPGRVDRRTVLTSLTRTGRRRLAELNDALEQYFIESGPLVEEIISLLDVDVPSARGSEHPETPLDVAGRLGAVGAPFVEQIAQQSGTLSPRARLALTTLFADGPLRPGQLAETLELTSGGLTYLADQLEAEGLIERSYGLLPEDRRAVVIHLTDQGAELVAKVVSILDSYAVGICAALAGTLHYQTTS